MKKGRKKLVTRSKKSRLLSILMALVMVISIITISGDRSKAADTPILGVNDTISFTAEDPKVGWGMTYQWTIKTGENEYFKVVSGRSSKTIVLKGLKISSDTITISYKTSYKEVGIATYSKKGSYKFKVGKKTLSPVESITFSYDEKDHEFTGKELISNYVDETLSIKLLDSNKNEIKTCKNPGSYTVEVSCNGHETLNELKKTVIPVTITKSDVKITKMPDCSKAYSGVYLRDLKLTGGEAVSPSTGRVISGHFEFRSPNKKLTYANLTEFFTGNEHGVDFIPDEKEAPFYNKTYAGTIKIDAEWKTISVDYSNTKSEFVYTGNESDTLKVLPVTVTTHRLQTVGEAIDEVIKWKIDFDNTKSGSANAVVSYQFKQNGKVLTGVPVNAGEYTVIATAYYDGYGSNNSGERKLIINRKPITEDMISLSDLNYDGKTKSLIVKDGDKTLVLNTDYKINEIKGDLKGPDPVTVTVEGLGNYKDTASKTFKFKKQNVSNKLTVVANDKVYTGETISLGADDISVKVNDETLVFGTDYDISYTKNIDRINVGTVTGKVTIKDTNKKYTGAADFSFKITPKEIQKSWIQDPTNLTYDGNAKTITVKDGKKTLVLDKDYTVSYENQKGLGDVTYTVTGKENYKGTVSGFFTVGAKKIDAKDITVKAADKYYTGNPIKLTSDDLTVKVKEGNKTVPLSSSEYEIDEDSYKNNTEATTADKKASVTIKLKGTRSGSKTVNFNIIKVEATVIANGLRYTKENATRTITLGTVILKEEVKDGKKREGENAKNALLTNPYADKIASYKSLERKDNKWILYVTLSDTFTEKANVYILKKTATKSSGLNGDAAANYITYGTVEVYTNKIYGMNPVTNLSEIAKFSDSDFEKAKLKWLDTYKLPSSDAKYYNIYAYRITWVSTDSSFHIDLVVEPNFYTVDFKDGDKLLESTKVVKGEAVQPIADPTKTDASGNSTYEFKGWSETKNGQPLDMNSYIPTKDTTLYAVFEKKPVQYTVTFVVEGQTVATQTINKPGKIDESKVTKPVVNPTEDNSFEFIGWSTTEDGKNIVELSSINTTTTLYATFAKQYTITFDGVEDENPNPITLNVGTYLGEDQIPTATKKEDNFSYQFLGWSTSDKEEDIVNFNTLDKNITVYPVFSKTQLTYDVTFVYGEDSSTVTVNKGDNFNPEDAPEATKAADVDENGVVENTYIFTKWTDNEDGEGSVDLAAINSAITLYANFQKQYTVYFADAEGTGFISSLTKNVGVNVSDDELAAVEAPAYPQEDEYYTHDFTQWLLADKTTPADFTAISKNTVVYPSWDSVEVKFTITFIVEGVSTSRSWYGKNAQVKQGDVTDPTKAEDDTNTYAFAGWVDPDTGAAINLVGINTDTTVEASFTATAKPVTGPETNPEENPGGGNNPPGGGGQFNPGGETTPPGSGPVVPGGNVTPPGDDNPPAGGNITPAPTGGNDNPAPAATVTPAAPADTTPAPVVTTTPSATTTIQGNATPLAGNPDDKKVEKKETKKTDKKKEVKETKEPEKKTEKIESSKTPTSSAPAEDPFNWFPIIISAIFAVYTATRTVLRKKENE